MANHRSNSPHDALFRKVLENEEARRAIITDNLQGRLREALRDQLVGPGRLLETTQVDRDSLGRTAADGLVEFELASGRRALVDFLLEHKSVRDARALLRILRRKLAIWERHLDGGGGRVDALPLIVFMLFYHGKRRWRVPGLLDIAFGKGEDWLGLRMQGVPVDLTRMELGGLSSDAFAQMAFHSLLYGTGVVSGFEALSQSAVVLPGARFDKYRRDPDLSAPIVSYMLALGKDDRATIKAALDVAQPRIGGKIMLTAADEIRAEGQALGRTEGKLELLAQFMQGRFGSTPSGIAKLMQGATPAQLDAWAQRLFKGESLEAIFGKAARRR